MQKTTLGLGDCLAPRGFQNPYQPPESNHSLIAVKIKDSLIVYFLACVAAGVLINAYVVWDLISGYHGHWLKVFDHPSILITVAVSLSAQTLMTCITFKSWRD